MLGKGYKMDPLRLSGLRDMNMSKAAAGLAELIYCPWISVAIPNFVQRNRPRSEELKLAYAKSGKRTKTSIKKIGFRTLSWGRTHEEAFQLLYDSLRSSVALFYMTACDPP